jgi:hypothetical protein
MRGRKRSLKHSKKLGQALKRKPCPDARREAYLKKKGL